MPGQYHRPLRRVDQFCGALDHQTVPFQSGLVSGKCHLLSPIDLHLFSEDVLGDVHEYRTRSTRIRYVERFLDYARDLGSVHNQVVVLGDGQRDAGNVGLLEGVRPDRRPPHLSRDHHHRHRVHLRRCYSGHQVGSSGPGRCPRHSRTPGHPRVAVRRVRSALLVSHEYVSDLRILRQCLVERQDRAPRKAEDNVHAFSNQRFADYLSACAYHCSNLRTPPTGEDFLLKSPSPLRERAGVRVIYTTPIKKTRPLMGRDRSRVRIPRGTTQVARASALDHSPA